MVETSLHPALDKRLATLRSRIDGIRRAMSLAPPAEKMQAAAALAELERRFAALDAQVRALSQEAPGLRQSIKAEVILMADDLVGMSEDLMTWIETGSHPDPYAR
jgi:predicted  nucleic acid-binding Zn-ribbon protein